MVGREKFIKAIDSVFEQKSEIEMSIFEQVINNSLEDKTTISHNPNPLHRKFPQHIERLAPILHLTTHGKYYFSCFSFEAIKAALQPLERAQLTGSSFRYFEKVLKSYCQKHNQEPNWDNLGGITTAELEQPMVVKETNVVNKAAVKEWLRSCSFSKEIKINQTQPTGVRQQIGSVSTYCCASCQLNKTHGALKVTGALRVCDKERNKIGDEYTERSGELRSEAREKLYNNWKTLEGTKNFAETVKLSGWENTRFYVNGFLPKEDWLPEEKPEDVVRFIFTKAYLDGLDDLIKLESFVGENVAVNLDTKKDVDIISVEPNSLNLVFDEPFYNNDYIETDEFMDIEI